MDTNEWRKKRCSISIIILVIILLTNSLPMYATSKKELQSEESSIDEKIDEKNSELANVQSQKSTALKQINTYNSQISSYENDIDDLSSKITELEGQIVEKKSNIAEQEKMYAEKKDILEKRLVAIYESGSTSYLDMLLSAESISDFLSKYYLLEQLTEYDTDLLKSIQDKKTQIETEKVELENSKAEVETSRTAIETKKNSLAVVVNEKNVLVSTLSDEERTIQDELEQFERDKKAIQEQLAEIARKEAEARKGTSNEITAPSTAGYICPIAGKTKSSITTGYRGYVGHTGVDFACGSGTSIMASKAGTVVISTALRYPSGSYRSYGEYIVISHGDGTMTLYAHMLSGSRKVREGDKVTQGQVIGQVGSTGNSTGPHLHFEVRVNGKCVNPTQYLP